MTRPVLSATGDPRLFHSLRELYAFSDMATYPRRVVAALGTLIPARFITYNEIHRDGARNRYVWWPPDTQPKGDRRLVKAFERHVGEHPLIAHYATTDDSRALAISDVMDRREFHRLNLYKEFFKKVGVEHQLAVTLRVSRGVVIGIALSRKTKDFSPRDKHLVQLLRPHLIQAYENALLTSRLKRRQASGAARDGHRPVLSARQLEVLSWVAGGKTNREIGAVLDLSPRTVQKHLEIAFQALGVETRTAAVMRAMELALPISPLVK